MYNQFFISKNKIINCNLLFSVIAQTYKKLQSKIFKLKNSLS